MRTEAFVTGGGQIKHVLEAHMPDGLPILRGGPSHVDLFDGKDVLTKLHGTDLPDSVRGGQRVTGMTSGQSSFPVVQPIAAGKPCGPAGWNITEDPHHIRDLNATMLNQLGIDRHRLTYPYRGLDQKLTGVEPAKVMSKILT